MQSPNENGLIDLPESKQPQESLQPDSIDRLADVHRLPPKRLRELRDHYRIDVCKAWRASGKWSQATEKEIEAECDRLIAKILPPPSRLPTPKPAQPNLPTIEVKPLSQFERAVWDAIAKAQDGRTRDELADLLERPIQSITPVVKSLLDASLIYRTAEKRATKYGRPATVLKVVKR